MRSSEPLAPSTYSFDSALPPSASHPRPQVCAEFRGVLARAERIKGVVWFEECRTHRCVSWGRPPPHKHNLALHPSLSRPLSLARPSSAACTIAAPPPPPSPLTLALALASALPLNPPHHSHRSLNTATSSPSLSPNSPL